MSSPVTNASALGAPITAEPWAVTGTHRTPLQDLRIPGFTAPAPSFPSSWATAVPSNVSGSLLLFQGSRITHTSGGASVSVDTLGTPGGPPVPVAASGTLAAGSGPVVPVLNFRATPTQFGIGAGLQLGDPSANLRLTLTRLDNINPLLPDATQVGATLNLNPRPGASVQASVALTQREGPDNDSTTIRLQASTVVGGEKVNNTVLGGITVQGFAERTWSPSSSSLSLGVGAGTPFLNGQGVLQQLDGPAGSSDFRMMLRISGMH